MKTRILDYHVPDVLLLEGVSYSDPRGRFLESWNEAACQDTQLPHHWPQDNVSHSHHGVLRGLHIQRRNPQGKLVRCLVGSIYDVAVDLRPDSPTRGRWVGTVLSDRSVETALWVPPGFAHGFQVISRDAVVLYKCSTLYDKDSDGGVCWKDPALAITWPEPEKAIVSAKDSALPSLKDYLLRSSA